MWTTMVVKILEVRRRIVLNLGKRRVDLNLLWLVILALISLRKMMSLTSL